MDHSANNNDFINNNSDFIDNNTEISAALDLIREKLRESNLNFTNSNESTLGKIFPQLLEAVTVDTNDLNVLLDKKIGEKVLETKVLENFSTNTNDVGSFQKFFIQIFIQRLDTQFNPLSDPYFLIEGDVKDLCICFKANYSSSSTNITLATILSEEIKENSLDKIIFTYRTSFINVYVSEFLKRFLDSKMPLPDVNQLEV